MPSSDILARRFAVGGRSGRYCQPRTWLRPRKREEGVYVLVSTSHFKVTRYLLRATRDSRYGDSMERVLYNTIAGATPILADGTSFYYSDYNEEGRKVHHRDKWPCCLGTFPQLTGDYGLM